MFQYVKEMELTTEIRAIRGIDFKERGVSIASIHFRRQSFCSLYSYPIMQYCILHIQMQYLPILQLLTDYFNGIFQCDVRDICEDL